MKRFSSSNGRQNESGCKAKCIDQVLKETSNNKEKYSYKFTLNETCRDSMLSSMHLETGDVFLYELPVSFQRGALLPPDKYKDSGDYICIPYRMDNAEVAWIASGCYCYLDFWKGSDYLGRYSKGDVLSRNSDFDWDALSGTIYIHVGIVEDIGIKHVLLQYFFQFPGIDEQAEHGISG